MLLKNLQSEIFSSIIIVGSHHHLLTHQFKHIGYCIKRSVTQQNYCAILNFYLCASSPASIMNWSLSHLRLLIFFFVTQVLLLFADVVTDLMSGLKLLNSREPWNDGIVLYPYYFFDNGIATFICMFLPSLPALMSLLWQLVQTQGKISNTMLTEFIFELPFCNVIKKLQYFLQLCFLDSTCPHNFALISEVKRLSLSASAYEAFLESVPQLWIQLTIFYINLIQNQEFCGLVLQISSVLLSFTSCCLSAINLFLMLRPSYFSDSNNSFKVKLVYLPMVALEGAGVCFLWLIIFAEVQLYAFFPFVFYTIIRFAIAITCCKKQNKGRYVKEVLIEVILSGFAPFIPWTPKKCVNLQNLMLNLLGAATMPFIILIIIMLTGININFKNIAIGSCVFMGICFLCIVIQWLGCYRNLYRISKIFTICCIEPVIHRSMIIYWLKNPKLDQQMGDSNLTFPEYFDKFIAISNELNKPELTNWDTVLHFAFRENQFVALIRMIQNGGNPFIRNKKGESVITLLESLTEEQAQIKEQLQEAIKNFEEKYPSTDQESGVHSAARKNQLKKLKRYKLFSASFDPYNNKRQKPVEVAMECGHLEVALFLMENTDGFFPRDEWKTFAPFLSTYSQDPNLRNKCLKFLANQTPEALDALKDKYPLVFKNLDDDGVLEA